MSFTDKFKAKYSKRSQNLPKNGVKKPSLSGCANCKRYERWDNGKDLHWCVSRGFDRIAKKSYTDYKNIELMEICPKND